MAKLDGKVAFITGASSGIGAAMAREFGRRGAHVVLTARRWERLEALALEVRARGRRALTVRCDVTVDGDSDIYGAIVGKTLTVTGSGSGHYDESLDLEQVEFPRRVALVD